MQIDGWLGRGGETENTLKTDAQRSLETGRALLRKDEANEDRAEASNSVRFDGAMQVLGGLAQAGIGALGVVTPEPVTTALGAGAVAIGADNVWTGAKTLWHGQPEQSVKRDILEAAAGGLGADDQTAARLADGAELGLDLAGPAGAAKAAGYGVRFWRYPNAGGFGVGVTRHGKRKFAADVHKFRHDGVEAVRPHLHYGSTGKQIRKHRPYEGGWRWS